MDKIYVFNNSKKIKENVIESSLSEIERIRPLDIILLENSDGLIKKCIKNSFERYRNQVNANKFLRQLIPSLKKLNLGESQRIVLFDEDLYYSGTNWVFGGFSRFAPGPGYIVLSANRVKNDLQMKDILCHETGHMFSAPRSGRKNTYESLGNHCSNELCVMQQKLTIEESIKFTIERASKHADTYCEDCKKDIASFYYGYF